MTDTTRSLSRLALSSRLWIETTKQSRIPLVTHKQGAHSAVDAYCHSKDMEIKT